MHRLADVGQCVSFGRLDGDGPFQPWARAISRIRPQLAMPLLKLLNTGIPIIHSLALVPSRWPELLNASDADLIHLHWGQDDMLSLADIDRIRKPIVLTLYDMSAFFGRRALHHRPPLA